jgi:hypothetical protein
MSKPGDLERKLDLLIALTRVGVSDALDRQRRSIESDPVSLALLKATSDAVSAGALKDTVREETKQSKATIERRMADLVSRGALLRQGTGSAINYRNSGLFEV